MNYNDIPEKVSSALKKDPTLRQRIIDDPEAAVLEVTGEKAPGKVTFHTAKENTFTFIIPLDEQQEKKAKLSIEDLGVVSGGRALSTADYPSIVGEGVCTGCYGVSGYDFSMDIRLTR